MKKPPRNAMDQGETLLRRHRDPVPEPSASDPDVDHLNGRDTVDHERDLLLEARRAERAEAADGILSGLIRTPKL